MERNEFEYEKYEREVLKRLEILEGLTKDQLDLSIIQNCFKEGKSVREALTKVSFIISFKSECFPIGHLF